MLNYLQISELCQNYFPDLSASELAGMFHGMVSHGFVPEQGKWQQQISDIINSGDPMEQNAAQEIEQLLAFTQKDYQADSYSIDLLIPEDDYPLPQRAQAVGEWAQGFLTGYGLIKQTLELEGDAKEALQDISEIAKIDSELSEDEEFEQAFMTICEHLKMSAQIIFIANQPKVKPESEQGKGAIH